MSARTSASASSAPTIDPEKKQRLMEKLKKATPTPARNSGFKKPSEFRRKFTKLHGNNPLYFRQGASLPSTSAASSTPTPQPTPLPSTSSAPPSLFTPPNPQPKRRSVKSVLKEMKCKYPTIPVIRPLDNLRIKHMTKGVKYEAVAYSSYSDNKGCLFVRNGEYFDINLSKSFLSIKPFVPPRGKLYVIKSADGLNWVVEGGGA